MSEPDARVRGSAGIESVERTAGTFVSFTKLVAKAAFDSRSGAAPAHSRRLSIDFDQKRAKA
jgi:hypothetical protein